MDIKKIIKKIDWDNKVRREGFLQSKQIVIRAECRPLKIADSILIKCKNQLWVKDMNLYGLDILGELPKKFDQAYKKDKNWPAKVIKDFDLIGRKCKLFFRKLKNSKFTKLEKIKLFQQYTELLSDIQRYYIIAAPLADYCELKLKKENPKLLAYAYPIKRLDIDDFNESLSIIQKTRGKQKDLMKKKHLEKFKWIKSSYNILAEYTEEDLNKELSFSSSIIKPKKYKKASYLLRGLQSGIFMRNRIKEVSQQLWFSIEPLAKQIAGSISIKRDVFFQMTVNEVLYALEKGKINLNKYEIAKRHKGFIIGCLQDRDILLTGKDVEIIYKQYYEIKDKNINILKGSIACVGNISGKVRIIIAKKDFNKFQEGEILVTSMTTPDYVTIMKRASAIITDEGGLSCHAAIVARELKKPCIIGTKIATQVLEDGDLVEVDANKGIVKIIKKA
jgi:phosphoenolpyruvate synthase/pyruvate phosphate dikinase